MTYLYLSNLSEQIKESDLANLIDKKFVTKIQRPANTSIAIVTCKNEKYADLLYQLLDNRLFGESRVKCQRDRERDKQVEISDSDAMDFNAALTHANFVLMKRFKIASCDSDNRTQEILGTQKIMKSFSLNSEYSLDEYLCKVFNWPEIFEYERIIRYQFILPWICEQCIKYLNMLNMEIVDFVLSEIKIKGQSYTLTEKIGKWLPHTNKIFVASLWELGFQIYSYIQIR
jgi:hypothetical protein